MISDPPVFESPARAALREALTAGNRWRAIQAARASLQVEPTIRNYHFLRKQIAHFQNQLSLKQYRVALLSSFTIEFIIDPLIVQGFLEGLDVEIYQAGFGQFRQEILDSSSGLYAFQPDLVVLACEGRDWMPGLYRDYLANKSNSSAVLAQSASEAV